MNKPNEFNAERLKNLIVQDKVLQVLEELKHYTKGRDKDMYDELIIHLNNINTVRKERGIGLISFKEEQGDKNHILIRLSTLIDDLEKVYGKNRFIIEFEGRFEELNEEKQAIIRARISELFNNSDFKIMCIYSGNIKFLLEFQSIDFSKLINDIETFNRISRAVGVQSVFYYESILKEVVISFYHLLLHKRINTFPLKGIFQNLKKYSLFQSFSQSHLTNIDLSRANLIYANLGYANLGHANLSGVDLRHGDLSCANLSGANLSSANLNGADLRYANLSHADLSHADLSHTNFNKAIISTETLMKAKTLYQCKGLTDTIKREILEKKPELFDAPNDSKRESFFNKTK